MWMMPVMTAQPPLPLAPGGARSVSGAAAIVEDDGGGRVFVHGNLAYAWEAGDTAGRRFAAVSLIRIKAATQLQVAEAFAVKPATVRRWDARLTDAGVAGLLPERKGPKHKSKLTGDTVAAIRRLREGGASYRAIAADVDSDERCAPTGSDEAFPQEQEQEQEVDVDAAPEVEVGPVPEVDAGGEDDCAATVPAVMAAPPVEVPVLADPVPRAVERVMARFGLIESAPPVFTACARAPLAGLLLALPALAATGLAQTAHAVYGTMPNGFYSLDTMLCEGVFRALLGLRLARRARPGSTRSRWGGCWGWTGHRRSRRSAARSGCSPRRARPAIGSPRWRAVMSRPAPRRRWCATSTGMCAPIRAAARSPKPMCPG
jgi:hypothetical protein